MSHHVFPSCHISAFFLPAAMSHHYFPFRITTFDSSGHNYFLMVYLGPLNFKVSFSKIHPRHALWRLLKRGEQAFCDLEIKNRGEQKLCNLEIKKKRSQALISISSILKFSAQLRQFTLLLLRYKSK